MPNYDLRTPEAVVMAAESAATRAGEERNQDSYNAAWLHGYARALQDVAEQQKQLNRDRAEGKSIAEQAQELVKNNPALARQIFQITDREYQREDIASRIEDLELDREFTDKDLNIMADRFEKSLSNNDGYWDSYWLTADYVIRDYARETARSSDEQAKEYRFTVEYEHPLNASFEIVARQDEKPSAGWLAAEIREQLGQHYSGKDLVDAIDSICSIELLIEQNGEYVDSDVLEEDALDAVIVQAKQGVEPDFLSDKVAAAEARKAPVGETRTKEEQTR